jgi:hypothetical protein
VIELACAQLERAEAAITQAGMVLVHTENRIKGSYATAIRIEGLATDLC